MIILTFSISSLVIVVLPTIIMDINCDKQFGINTFAVKYGINFTTNIIVISIFIQIITLFILALLFLLNSYFVGIFVIIIFLIGEKFVFSQIKYLGMKPKLAEHIANRLTFGYLIGGTFLLIILKLLYFFEINIDKSIKILIESI